MRVERAVKTSIKPRVSGNGVSIPLIFFPPREKEESGKLTSAQNVLFANGRKKIFRPAVTAA